MVSEPFVAGDEVRQPDHLDEPGAAVFLRRGHIRLMVEPDDVLEGRREAPALRQLPADDRVVDAQEVSLGFEEVGSRGLDVLEHLAERLGHERRQGDVADVVDEGGQKGLVGRNGAEACGDDLGRHARRQIVTPQTHQFGAAKDLGVQDADAQQVGEDFLEADGLKSGLDGCQITARVARPRCEAEDACGQGGVGLDGLLNLAGARVVRHKQRQ